MRDLPTGTVTFLFTDIEGSTNLARELGERWPAALEQHHAILRRAIREHSGTDIRTEGDAVFAVFVSAVDAIAACADAQRWLAVHAWPEEGPVRVRMGLHTGEGRLSAGEYVGLDVHRAARVAAAGQGGQVLISDATKALVADKIPAGVTLQDLGAHRLKDFEEPQGIHQLVIDDLPAEFPPLRSLEIPTNIPPELTSFVGRERELEEIERLLESTRLLSLTGPGGTGKTRLALRAASRLLGRFRNGAFFVDLSSTTDPDLVVVEIAGTVGVREEGSRPLLQNLVAWLRDRELLLVLDNFEQVLDAAPTTVGMLEAAAHLRLLITSRSPLRIRGEQELPVPPLGLPDPDPVLDLEQLSRSEAVGLFVQRAAGSDPSFALTEENAPAIATIARRLDGLPLAIEIAASRVSVLTPQEMVERLDRRLPVLGEGPRDLPARQRTLASTIGWSYKLMSMAGRTMFRRLAAFAGGWTAESAEAVCNPHGEIGAGTLDLLGVLVDSSLIRRSQTAIGSRFDMFQTIREFATEQLEAEAERRLVTQRHAEFFLVMTEAAQAELRGPRQMEWIGRLSIEHENLRSALSAAVEGDQGETALRFVGALWRFWHFAAYLSEGRAWATEVLALPSASGRTIHRVQALWALGGLAYWQLDHPAVLSAYREALEISEEIGDAHAIAESTYNMAYVSLLEGDRIEARARFREARAGFEKLGDARGLADALFGLSIMGHLTGDLTASRESAEQGLLLHRELGDLFGVEGSMFALGRAVAEMGDLETAHSLFLEALDAVELMGEQTAMAVFLDNMADLEIVRGRPLRAMRIAGASEGIKDTVGGEAPPEVLAIRDLREAARQTLTEEEIAEAWAEGRRMSQEEALAYAREPI